MGQFQQHRLLQFIQYEKGNSLTTLQLKKNHLNLNCVNSKDRVDEVPQQVKTRATKPDNLSSIPGIYVVEERNNSHTLSSDLHRCLHCLTQTCR